MGSKKAKEISYDKLISANHHRVVHELTSKISGVKKKTPVKHKINITEKMKGL